MNAFPLVVAGAFAVAAYTFYVRRGSGSKPPFAVVGPLSLTSLKLASSKPVNHDVKRLRFELPDQGLQSGLTLTSALLTISFPNGGWAPVLRPYTPVTDLGKWRARGD